MSRTLSCLLLAAAIFGTLTSSASAAVVCAYDAGVHRLTITAGATTDYPALTRDGTAIVVSSEGSVVDCSGDDPTVTNTDLIDITHGAGSNDTTIINLGNGALAPGFTSEGQFSSAEIEINVQAAESIRLLGSAAANTIRAGTEGSETRVNVTPGELIADADIVATGAERLSYYGGAGDDVMDARGGSGTGSPLDAHFVPAGEAGDDKSYAGPGGSIINSGADDDTLVGGSGLDYFLPEEGDDVVDGGAEDTIQFVTSLGVTVDLASGGPQDTGEGIDTITGVGGVNGTGGDDVLRGTDAVNVFGGYDGNDILEGRGGNDQLFGNDGTDVADYRSSPSGVTISIDPDMPVASGGAGTDVLGGFEDIIGSSHADELTGDDAANVIDGGPGADIMSGGDGADTLSYVRRAEPVAVTLDGFANDGADPDGDGVSLAAEEGDQETGFENASGGAGDDELKAEGTGANTLNGRGGADVLDGGLGADKLFGGTGIDTLSYAARPGRVAVKLDGFANDGADPDGNGTSSDTEERDRDNGIENAVGGTAADRLTGGTGANALSGGGGADRLDGGLGADRLDGGAGGDTISYAGRAGRVVVKLDGLANDGADPDGNLHSSIAEERDLDIAVENAIGGDGDDRLIALAAVVNRLVGGAGVDFLDARDAGAAADKLECGDGADTHRSDAMDVKTDCETPAPG